jgi:hypothetical protein
MIELATVRLQCIPVRLRTFIFLYFVVMAGYGVPFPLLPLPEETA